MEKDFTLLVLAFFCYSFVGWLWETLYCSLKARHFVYRGFLLGPITPIYGFAIVGVLIFSQPYQDKLWALFLLAFFLASVLEYVTSFLLEKLFHATLWDYKEIPLNINGRIALPISVFWGAACVFIVKVLNPHIISRIDLWYNEYGIFIALVLLMLISFDLGFTLANVASLRRALQELSEAIEEKKAVLEKNSKEQISSLKEDQQRLHQAARNWLNEIKAYPETRARLPRLNFQERRMLNGFPNMKSKELKTTLAEVRLLVKDLRNKK